MEDESNAVFRHIQYTYNHKRLAGGTFQNGSLYNVKHIPSKYSQSDNNLNAGTPISSSFKLNLP